MSEKDPSDNFWQRLIVTVIALMASILHKKPKKDEGDGGA